MVQSKEFYSLYQKLYEKYRDLYGKQVSIFLKKGSFYEFYGQQDPITHTYLNNAKEVMEILDVMIHVYPNDGPNGTTGFFGGIPEWTLDKWAGKLTKLGWTVVVLDENEEKDTKGKLVRSVSKILSPGTHVESAEGSEVFTIASLWLEATKEGPPLFGTTITDLTTGALLMYEGQATGTRYEWHTDDLRHLYQVYSPRELLIGWRNMSPLDDETLRRRFFLPTAVIQTLPISQEAQGPLERSFTREEYIRSILKPRTALPLRQWLHLPSETTQMERSLVILLRYIEEHIPTLASSLKPPTIWHPRTTLQVINNALTQLNFLGSSSIMPTGQQTIKDLFTKPQTAMGRRELGARLCMPLTDAKEIRKRHDDIAWCLDNFKKKTLPLSQCLTCMYDIPRLHRSIVRGICRAADIVQLYQSYQTIRVAWDLAGTASPFCETTSIPGHVDTCLSTFDALFDITKAKKALDTDSTSELGFLQASRAPQTAATEEAIRAIYTKAQEWLKTLLGKANVESQGCYFKPTEKNVFSVHVTKAAYTLLKKYVDSSTVDPLFKKITFKGYNSSYRLEHHFLTTCLEQLDTAKATFTKNLKEELVPLCNDYIQNTYASWEPLEQWVVYVDLAITMAKTADHYGFVRPQIDECDATTASGVRIENLRHPLIEIQKTRSKYVTHNVDLGYTTTTDVSWLLYGMNASGKSSLMKAIGVAVLLAQVGSYVPATGMWLRPFQKIATRILNQDNLWAGLSSFAVEMSELREIFQVADHQTLVLGDELCAGTESISATAIVAAGIRWLEKCGSRFVLATHLHDLMKLEEIRESKTLRVWHLHVEYDHRTGKLLYHRDLRPGSGSTLYGLEVAKALHLPPDMLSIAHTYRQILMNNVPLERRSSSRYNAMIVRRQCDICGIWVERDLEVHHIQPQEDAWQGRNADGTALNSVRNLAVICDSCHTKHHSHEIEIGSVIDTSEGPERPVLSARASEGPERPVLSAHSVRASEGPDVTEEQNPLHSLDSFRYKGVQEETQSVYTTQTQKTAGRSRKQAADSFTNEQEAQIQECIQEYKYLDPKLIVCRIKERYEIDIKVSQVKKRLL